MIQVFKSIDFLICLYIFYDTKIFDRLSVFDCLELEMLYNLKEELQKKII